MPLDFPEKFSQCAVRGKGLNKVGLKQKQKAPVPLHVPCHHEQSGRRVAGGALQNFKLIKHAQKKLQHQYKTGYFATFKKKKQRAKTAETLHGSSVRSLMFQAGDVQGKPSTVFSPEDFMEPLGNEVDWQSHLAPGRQ